LVSDLVSIPRFFVLLPIFGFVHTFRVSERLVRRLVKEDPDPHSFGATCSHLTSVRFCLPSIFSVVDDWGFFVMFETLRWCPVHSRKTSYHCRHVQSDDCKHVSSCRFFILPLNVPWMVAADFAFSDFVEENAGRMKFLWLFVPRLWHPSTGVCLMADHRLLHLFQSKHRARVLPGQAISLGRLAG
jgi:hypothetical protein